MTAPLVLVALAVLVATVGPWLLRRSGWPDRSPRVGVMAWQALSASVVLAVVLAGLSLAVPVVPFTVDLAELLRACAMAVQAQYATPGGVAASAGGAMLALAVLGRAGYCLTAGLAVAVRGRRRQLRTLAVLARRHDGSGALVVDHPVAAAYCLPGRHREVVLTSAALAALDGDQLAAVLAHERAHLRGRHHLVLAVADALRRAFPWVPAFRVAHHELVRLVELLADDRAVRTCGRLTVATALVRLAGAAPAPAPALSAGGDTAVARVRRLAAPADPLATAHVVAAMVMASVVIAAPVLVVAAPAIAAAQAQLCPTGLSVPPLL